MDSFEVTDSVDCLHVQKYRSNLNKIVLGLSDAIAFFVAAIIVYGIGGLRGTTVFPIAGGYGSATGITRTIFLTSLAVIGILWFWGKLRHYSYRKPFWSELKEIFQTISLLALLDLASLAFSKRDFSRFEWLLLWLLILTCVPLFRAFSKLLLSRLGVWKIPCVIVGTGDNAYEAYRAISSEKLMGMDIKAFIGDGIGESPVKNIPVISHQQYWDSCATKVKVYIALEHNEADLAQSWLRELSTRGVRNISVIPSIRGIPLYGTDMSHFFSHEVMILRLRNNLARLSSRFVKRLFDVVVSFLLLILFSPLFLYIALKVKKDGGSITYGHERIGYQGKSFQCLKFRSMVVNSQEVLAQLLATDPQAKAEWEKYFKLKNDPRITPIGHFLRRTSLDELPQLWNVFKGEMSLVGPRPVVKDELERYSADVEYYLMVKPGMTGLWQVSGRSDTDYATRVYFDSWYVKNWSLWYDIAILFKTARVVIKHDGAY